MSSWCHGPGGCFGAGGHTYSHHYCQCSVITGDTSSARHSEMFLVELLELLLLLLFLLLLLLLLALLLLLQLLLLLLWLLLLLLTVLRHLSIFTFPPFWHRWNGWVGGLFYNMFHYIFLECIRPPWLNPVPRFDLVRGLSLGGWFPPAPRQRGLGMHGN